MGRDTAQITHDIDRARADLAITLRAIRSTDLKHEVAAKADGIRDVAALKAKAKIHELRPVLAARAQEKIAELRPLLRARAQEKVAELRPLLQARAQEKVAELRPLLQARAQEKVAELRPLLQARAQEKVAELRPLLQARAQEKVAELKAAATARATEARQEIRSRARHAVTTKVADAKTAAVDGATGLAARTSARLPSKLLTAGAAGSSLTLGLGLIATRRAVRRRSRTRLQRVVDRSGAADRLHRARDRAADGLHPPVSRRRPHLGLIGRG
jgi:hypothetical protein